MPCSCCMPEGHEGPCRSFMADEARARAIRAVVAAQWGVAVALFDDGTGNGSRGGRCATPALVRLFPAWEYSVEHVASLPSAVDLIDGGGT